MKWLKAAILSILFLILMQFALGEINIVVPERETYNLGEKIAASASILETQAYDGFLKVMINCENYDLQYYTIPLNLEANFRTQIQVPELPLFASMKGACSIGAEFEDTDGERISKADSITFFVTDKLNISTSEIIDAFPNGNITLEGNVKKINGENLEAGDVKITFRNLEYNTKTEFGNFKYNLLLEPELDVGNYQIFIVASDKYKNHADVLVQLNILPLATRIQNVLESEKIRPGSELKARIILYDHKDRAMNGTINVSLVDDSGKKLLSKNVNSMDWLTYQFSRDALPGMYAIISKASDLREETYFAVDMVRQISMSYDNESVIVENIGNVDYDDETTIILQSDNKKYLVNKKIKLKPSEIMRIDLSKEVPFGNYDVILPETEKSQEQQEKAVNETKGTGEVKEESKILNATIHDNRPVYKKVGSGLSAVTGAVVQTGGYIASRPLLASIILILIILIIVFYYSRDVIINKIRGKKPGDTGYLFKDYKYR